MEASEKTKAKNPCYKCADRTPGCHGPCERYAGWKQEVQELKAQIFSEKGKNAADGVLADGFRKRKQKWCRSLKP